MLVNNTHLKEKLCKMHQHSATGGRSRAAQCYGWAIASLGSNYFNSKGDAAYSLPSYGKRTVCNQNCSSVLFN